MPFGRVQMSGTPPIGGNPGNVMAEIARRWLQQRQAIQGRGQPGPGADAAMARMLGLAGAPPISAGIEGGMQPQQQMPGGLMGRIAAAPTGPKQMVPRPGIGGSGVMRNAAMPIPASKPMVPGGFGGGVQRSF